MNDKSIFTVTNEDLGRLDSTKAVLVFRELLWAEAQRIGIEISKINVSSRINVPDGGVDATVDDAQIETGRGIIKPGKTSYQIKSGETFKPWQEGEIKDELFGRGNPVNKEHLGESIRACLDADGTYVLVCTGIDLVDSYHRNALNHIKEFLKQCGYSHPKVKVWSQNNLIGFLKLFPSLALWINGNDGGNFQTHNSWSEDEDMRVQFVQGASQDNSIAIIQNELRRNDDTVHVRVLGEPGIGKTKLVWEATKVADLRPLVIYCLASQFRDSDLMNNLLREDNDFSAVLVIDECDPDSRSYIWNKLRYRGARIKLISIYKDYDPISDVGISKCEIVRLDDQQISEIIQHHTIPKIQADRYAYFCSGSPKMAHHVGTTLAHFSEDPSQILTDDYFYRSFYIDFGRENPDSAEVQQRELVLQYIALFKQFGFEKSAVTDAQAIFEKIKAAGEQISWNRFKKIVDSLKGRKILQGDFTLYITPKALHLKLWTEWWRLYGNPFDLEAFIQSLTPKLVEWFYEMFKYAFESDVTSRLVKEFLGPDGPFGDGEYLKTELGSRFFFALTEADSKAALSCLERTVGSWDRETLLQFTVGRRNVIWALEKIAMQRKLFAGAGKLLLALGEAENEGYSNNASGVFAELFSPGPGKVAPTKASPAERFPVLKEALEAGSKERRTLALRACDTALQSGHFSRIVGAEYQGLRPEDELWVPKTYGELWDAYRCVWKLLEEQLEHLPEDEHKAVVEVLLERARGIGRISELADMVVDTVATIGKKTSVNEKQVIERIGQILRYDGKDLPTETRLRWEQLRDELVGSDFHSLMQRYVGMDLLEDRFDEDQNYVDQAQPRIETLAQQVVETSYLLQSELHWLVTVEAKKGDHFGYELGKRDNGFCLLPTLLDAQRNAGENASVYFLGGYFRAIFEKDVLLWEEQLDALVDDAMLNIAIPELTHCSGLTDRAGLRLLNLAENGIIGINHFAIFIYGKTIESLSHKGFTKWIEFLMSANDDKSAVSIALCLYHGYYVTEKPEPTLPPDLTFRVLSHPSLFEESDKYQFDVMTDYYWAEIGKAFLHGYPERSLELVEPMLAHFGMDGSIVSVDSEVCSVLGEIMKQHPTEVWKRVSKLLEDQTRFSRTVALERWLRGGDFSNLVPMEDEDEKGILTLIPPEKIWEWVDTNVGNRARYFARRLVPKTLSRVEWRNSLVREILVRYGMREDVKHALISNYLTEGWSGPASLHYKDKQQMLLDIKDGEDDENVIQWIDEFVEGLKEIAEQARIDEERMF